MNETQHTKKKTPAYRCVKCLGVMSPEKSRYRFPYATVCVHCSPITDF